MEALDAIFTADYATAQKAMVERVKETGLIVVDGPDLLLYLQGRLIDRATTNAPPAYADLKTIDHIPLAVFVLLLPDADAPSLSAATRSRIRRYISALEDVSPSIAAERFPQPGSLARQRSIQKASLQMLRRTREADKIDKRDLIRFARSQRAAIEANFSEAVDAQLRSIDETIRHWRSTRLTPGQWNSICVVILGAATAHHRELHLQYFSEVMGVPRRGTDRLIYYEGIDLESAFETVGRYRLDGEVSIAFFDDPSRLFTDIFANAARDWLARHRAELDAAPPSERTPTGSAH